MRPFHLALLGTGFLIVLAACGGDGPAGPAPTQPLEIESLTPAPDATNVETGATVAVVFNQAIDPATLTSETFTVSVGGTALATALSYEATTRTASAAAPFLPGETYEVQVTTGVRTPADSGLSETRQWTLSTRPWQATTVDVVGGAYSSLAVDATGRVHVSYYDLTNHDLRYATCATGCEAVAWPTATVDAAADVGIPNSLALDAAGRLHVSYRDATNAYLKYATCGTGCEAAGNWQTATVGAAVDVGGLTSLAVDAMGRLHASYYDVANRDLKYATWAAVCEGAGNWQAVTVDATGNVGFSSSLAVDATGRLHVTYRDFTNFDLKYGTCVAICEAAGSWQTATVDAAGDVGGAESLAVDASGRST